MSIASVRPGDPSPTRPNQSGKDSAKEQGSPQLDQGDRLIGDHLEAVRAALWRSVFVKNVLILAATLFTAFLAFIVVDQWLYSFGSVLRMVWFLALVGLTCWWTITRLVPLVRMRVSPEYAAYSIEHDEPQLQHSLTSYVTLRDEREAPGLRGIVVRSIGARAAKHLTTSGMSMPTETLGNFRTGMFTAAAFAALVLYAVLSPKNTAQTLTRLAAPLSSVAPPSRVSILEVTPGNTEALFGRSIEVTARVSGLNQAEVPTLNLGPPSNRSIDFSPTSQLNSYSAAIPGSLVEDNLQYQVVAGDARSDWFNVVVRDEPTVNVTDVRYNPHPYTGLPPRTTNVGTIDGIEGTPVTVIAQTNRKIVRGRIEFNPRQVAGQSSATAGFAPLDISDDGRTVSATWNLRSGRRGGGQVDIDSYRLRVWDDTETFNPDPIEYPIRVSADLSPEIRITVPATWPKDVPLGAEQSIEVRATDPDFGLSNVQLRIRRGTRLLETIELLSEPSGVRGAQVLLYSFQPDKLGLMSGDLITIEAVAYDNRTNIEGTKPDPNVVVSDPIELNIVDRPAQNEVIEDGDGLQKPRPDQPEKETAQENDNPSQDTSDPSDQSGDSQEAGDKSGGQEASEKQEGQSGEGKQGENQPESGQEDQQQQGGSGSSEQENAEQGEGQGGGGGQSSESGQQNQNSNPQQNSEPKNGGAKSPSNSSEDNSKQNSAGSDAGSENSDSESNENSPENSTGQESTAGQGKGSGAGDPIESNNSAPASKSDSPQSKQGPRSPATSDGEAIERMRDYLKEKQSKNAEPTPPETPDSNSEEQSTSESKQQSGNGQRKEDLQNGTNRPGDQPKQEGADDADPQPQDSGANNKTRAKNGTGQGTGKRGSQDQQTESDLNNNRSNNSPERDESPDPATGPDAANRSDSPKNDRTDGTDPANGEKSGEKSSDPESTDGGSASAAENDRSKQQESTAKNGEGKEKGERSESGQSDSGQGTPQPSGEQAEDGSSLDPNQEPESNQEKEPGSNASRSGGGKSGDTSDSPQSSKPDSNRSQSQEQSPPSSPEEQGSTGQSSTTESGSQTASQPNAKPPQDPSKGSESKAADGNAVGNNSLGEQMPSTSQPGSSAPPQAPDPVDIEAAKKATDLVLDSLKNQRDNPDQELLDRLGWTPDQLRRFVDRWEKTRALGDRNDRAAKQQYEEALKSLGIRPPESSAARRSTGRDDNLRQLQDTGSRMAPPPQFRDAIEAYRRSLKDN